MERFISALLKSQGSCIIINAAHTFDCLLEAVYFLYYRCGFLCQYASKCVQNKNAAEKNTPCESTLKERQM
jgi:hypothetical protein